MDEFRTCFTLCHVKTAATFVGFVNCIQLIANIISFSILIGSVHNPSICIISLIIFGLDVPLVLCLFYGLMENNHVLLMPFLYLRVFHVLYFSGLICFSFLIGVFISGAEKHELISENFKTEPTFVLASILFACQVVIEIYYFGFVFQAVKYLKNIQPKWQPIENEGEQKEKVGREAFDYAELDLV